MAVITRYKKKRGRRVVYYEAVICIGGNWITSKCFDVKTAAYVWHDETKRLLIRGSENPGHNMTVLIVVMKYRESAFLELRKSSQQARESRFCYILDSPMAKVPMEDLNPKVIDVWIDWLKALPTAKSTKRHSFAQELKLLNVILNWYKNEIDYQFVIPIVERHRKRCPLQAGSDPPTRLLYATR